MLSGRGTTINWSKIVIILEQADGILCQIDLIIKHNKVINNELYFIFIFDQVVKYQISTHNTGSQVSITEQQLLSMGLNFTIFWAKALYGIIKTLYDLISL